MAKVTSKGDVSARESDNENPRSTRKQSNSTSKSASKDKGRVEDDDEGSGDEDEEDDEEFEIEAILDAKHGTFPEVCHPRPHRATPFRPCLRAMIRAV